MVASVPQSLAVQLVSVRERKRTLLIRLTNSDTVLKIHAGCEGASSTNKGVDGF